MKIAAYICLAVAFAAATSGFLWAAFDISWWTPMADGKDGRIPVLILLHVFGGVFSCVAGCYIMAAVGRE